MLKIKAISRFKKDLKYFRRKPFVLSDLNKALNKLILRQKKLDPKHQDHSL